MSRVLNWGEGYVGDLAIKEILRDIDNASRVDLDRWLIRISKEKKRSFKRANVNETEKELFLKADKKYMNNYISVGCDALVTLNFHRQRNDMFFANRLLNKVWKFSFGFKKIALFNGFIEL